MLNVKQVNYCLWGCAKHHKCIVNISYMHNRHITKTEDGYAVLWHSVFHACTPAFAAHFYEGGALHLRCASLHRPVQMVNRKWMQHIRGMS